MEKLLKENHGFSLLEILIAMVLMVAILGLSLNASFSSKDTLDKEVSGLERALRFMNDEAVLKNKVVRLHLQLDKNPQEYSVEYGPSDSFILPSQSETETVVTDLEEDKAKKKEINDTNLKFNKIIEFQDSNSILNDSIKIIGVAKSTDKKIYVNGDISIYAFPTGEREDSLLLIASDEDVVSLKINGFSNKIKKENYPLEKNSELELEAKYELKSKEIFEKWQKEK